MTLFPKLKHLFVGGSNVLAALPARRSFKKCGRNVHFSPLNSDFSYDKIEIGDDVYIGPRARFSARESLKIGNKVTFGPGVTIMGGNHNVKEVGRGAVVGAGAVVTKDVRPYEIVGGNPCRHLKMRFTPEQIERHEALLYKTGK